MDGKKRAWGLQLADLLGAYPGLDDRRACALLGLTYEREYQIGVALWLNVERVRWRTAAVVAAGVGAVGAHDLEPEWAWSLTYSAAEAERLLATMNNDRAYARARAEAEQ